MITASMLLDSGVAMNGRLPDIYWDMNLSGTEIKVLKYVYDNCLRLYNTVKVFPKGKDGSPRFWRGKERMADDCGLSYPTFRNNVRHLHKLGLVTTMDGDVESEEPYCIGVTCDFLEPIVNRLQTENNFRSHLTFINLLEILYSKFVLSFLNLETLERYRNIPLLFSYENSKPDGTNSFVPSVSNSTNKAKKSKRIVRTPIFVNRQPIMILPDSMRLQNAKKKLELLKHIRTPHEKKLLEICDYYEFKCRQVLHSSGFRALGKDFRNHKNWKFLDRLNSLCEENNWDYQIYIDSQFSRVGYWKRKQEYPYLNQFFSQNAIKCYHNYIKEHKENNSIIGNGKIKTSKVLTLNQQIINDVIQDCESISSWMSIAEKRRQYKGLEREQLKMLYLSDHWFGLSVSYLASISWFPQYLEQFSGEDFVQDINDSLQRLKSNRKTYELTLEIVQKVESQMELPVTMCL